MATKHLDSPVVGMAASQDGRGYWLAGADGGVFNFGDASFFGSATAENIPAPVVGIVACTGAHGYWLAGAKGDIYNFGAAGAQGRTMALNEPIVAIAAMTARTAPVPAPAPTTTTTTTTATTATTPSAPVPAPLPAPGITSVSPSAGPLAGGGTVVITGSGFTGAYEVTFGDASSVPFTVVSNSEITVVSPPLGGGDASAPLLVFASGPPAFSPYDFTYETP